MTMAVRAVRHDGGRWLVAVDGQGVVLRLTPDDADTLCRELLAARVADVEADAAADIRMATEIRAVAALQDAQRVVLVRHPELPDLLCVDAHDVVDFAKALCAKSRDARATEEK